MMITLCGSMQFASDMLHIARVLESRGITVLYPSMAEQFTEGAYTKSDEARLKKQHDLMRAHFSKIVASDAILVVNCSKNGLQGWIGANTFLEMGLAHHLRKRIFLLHAPGGPEYISDELAAMEFSVLDGNVEGVAAA